MKKTLSILLACMMILPMAANAYTAPTLSAEHSTDGIIAKVNDDVILKSELIAAMTALDAEYRSQGIQATPARLQNQALDSLIMHKLQMSIIRRANVTPNENVINSQLLQIAQNQGMSSLQELQVALDSRQAGSYAALRKQLIEEAALQALWQHQIQSRVKISDQEIEAFLASPDAATLNQEEYSLIHIRVPFVGDSNSVTDSQKQAALTVANRVKTALENGQAFDAAMTTARGNYGKELEGAQTGFVNANQLPTGVIDVVSRLNKSEVSSPIITRSGVDVIMLQDKRTNNTMLIPEWQTSHILVGVNSNQTDTLARQRIEDIYNQLQQGANFAELATTYSEDVGSATNQGSLGWVNEGVMVQEFETMMKNTEKGDYSTPFRTQFGWHILKVNDIRQRDVTQEYHREMAREILFNRLAPQAQEDWLQELRASAYIELMK